MSVVRRTLPLLLFLLAPARPLHAWSRPGHAEIARIAQSFLSVQVQAQVEALLKDDLNAQGAPSGRRSLAEIASWPDELRDLAPPGTYQGWHARANPVCGEALGPCPDGQCVDELIEHFGKILQDPQQPIRQRNEALKWVVHLIGDLHQPLHSGVAEDKGKSPVRSIRGHALKPGATLHSVWDGQLAKRALKGWRHRMQPGDLPLESSPQQWMQESRAVALQNVYRPLPGFRCQARLPAVLDLDDAYVKQAVPAIRLQIERAALRLADKLNLWLH